MTDKTSVKKKGDRLPANRRQPKQPDEYIKFNLID